MNTLEYINCRISDGSGDWLSDFDWDNVEPINPIDFFSNMFLDVFDKNKESITTDTEDRIVVKNELHQIEILYEEDIQEPDFLFMYHLSHDGTLLFSRNMFWENAFSKLINATSIGKRNYETVFSEDDFEEDGMLKEDTYFSYDKKYIIGDLLWGHVPVKHVDEEHGKMFPGIKDFFAMSVRLELVKKK